MPVALVSRARRRARRRPPSAASRGLERECRTRRATLTPAPRRRPGTAATGGAGCRARGEESRGCPRRSPRRRVRPVPGLPRTSGSPGGRYTPAPRVARHASSATSRTCWACGARRPRESAAERDRTARSTRTAARHVSRDARSDPRPRAASGRGRAAGCACGDRLQSAVPSSALTHDATRPAITPFAAHEPNVGGRREAAANAVPYAAVTAPRIGCVRPEPNRPAGRAAHARGSETALGGVSGPRRV